MEGIARKLGHEKGNLGEWYRVSGKALKGMGASGLLDRYENSMPRLLANLYPNYDWLPWNFAFGSKNAFVEKSVLEKGVKFMEKEFDLAGPSDWYRVTAEQLKSNRASKVISAHGGLFNSLSKIYLDFNHIYHF